MHAHLYGISGVSLLIHCQGARVQLLTRLKRVLVVCIVQKIRSILNGIVYRLIVPKI